MKSGNYELSVFIQSINSANLEKTTFYTIILCTGPKQIQLPQKKSLTESNLISFLETLSLKLTHQQLQLANRQAVIQVYSVQKYGNKKLLAKLKFQIENTNRKEIRARFNFNSDLDAQIKLSYGFFKVQSRVLSQKGSLSCVSRSSTPKQIKKQLELYFLPDLIKTQKQRTRIEPISSVQVTNIETQFKTSYSQQVSKRQSGDTTACADIQQQLKLMESCQNALQNCKKSQVKQLSNDQKTTKEVSKSEFFDKIYQLKGNLNKVHQKQQILQDEQHIQNLVYTQLQSKQGPITYKIQSLHGSKKQFAQKPFQQSKQIIQYNFHKQSIVGNNNSRTQLIGSLSPQNFDQNVSFANVHPLSLTQAGNRQKKVALIKPKTKVDSSYQQWQNDDNLRNVVRQNIDQVKGCNGFIKLSKLLFLRKKYEDARKSNKFLSDAMNILVQNEIILKKKLQISDKIIKQKQEILNNELNLLRNQFKQVSNKLLDKYKEEAFREQKLKQVQIKNQKYQQKIRELNHQLELKAKHVHHLRQALIHYQQHQTVTTQLKKDQSKNQSKQKELKFKRNSTNNLLKRQVLDSSRKNKLSTEKDKSQLLSSPFSKENLDQLKGINPTFIDFFTSFRTKMFDSNQRSENYTKPPFKRNRIYQKNRNQEDNEPSISNTLGILFTQI